MKVFISMLINDSWFSSEINKCFEDEIVIFPLFQTEWNLTKDEIFMMGITSKKMTATITVRNLNISEEFYKELIKESIEEYWKIRINYDGTFKVKETSYNLNNITSELIRKAEKFNEYETLKISGKQIYNFN